MAVSRTSSNCADLRNILIMLIWVIKISIVKGICIEPDIHALPTDSKCPRPLLKMRLCGTRTPTVCAMPQNVTQVFHKYGTQGASKVTELRTVEQCVHGCVTSSSCYAVDWNTKYEECWFHENETSCNTRNAESDVDHYKMRMCGSGWECSKQCGSGCCQRRSDFLQNQQSCVCHVGYTGDTCSSPTTCYDPGSGENTTVPSQDYNIGDVKQYTCIQGHFLENNSTSKTLLCQIDGTWNDTAAKCKPGHCAPPDVGNNATSSKVPPYHVHQHVDFECPTGHVFPDRTSVKTVTCTANLTFNASIPNCSRVQCQLPQNLTHMKPRESGPHLFEDHVHLDCDTGYVLPATNQTSISLVCMENGQFNQTKLPACKPRSCPLPTYNQNLTMDGSASFTFPDSKSFHCPKGYLFPGKQDVITVECQANGTLSRDSLPSCSPVYCNDIRSLSSNLSVSPMGPFLYGSVVNVTCPDSFHMGLGGTYVTLRCRKDGTWEPKFPDCFKTSGQNADKLAGQPENIAAISAGAGTAAVVVILVVVVLGLVYWRRRGKEKNDSSQDHKNQPSSTHRLSKDYNNTQDVSETGFSSAVVSSPNAQDDVKLHTKAKEQESTIADLYAVPERKKKARACTASDTAGDSVHNPSDLYAVPERKKKKNSQPSAIQGTSEPDSDDYQLATDFGDNVSDDDIQMVENDLYEDSDGRPTDVTGEGQPPSEGVVFRENSIYGS